MVTVHESAISSSKEMVHTPAERVVIRGVVFIFVVLLDNFFRDKGPMAFIHVNWIQDEAMFPKRTFESICPTAHLIKV